MKKTVNRMAKNRHPNDAIGELMTEVVPPKIKDVHSTEKRIKETESMRENFLLLENSDKIFKNLSHLKDKFAERPAETFSLQQTYQANDIDRFVGLADGKRPSYPIHQYSSSASMFPKLTNKPLGFLEELAYLQQKKHKGNGFKPLDFAQSKHVTIGSRTGPGRFNVKSQSPRLTKMTLDSSGETLVTEVGPGSDYMGKTLQGGYRRALNGSADDILDNTHSYGMYSNIRRQKQWKLLEALEARTLAKEVMERNSNKGSGSNLNLTEPNYANDNGRLTTEVLENPDDIDAENSVSRDGKFTIAQTDIRIEDKSQHDPALASQDCVFPVLLNEAEIVNGLGLHNRPEDKSIFRSANQDFLPRLVYNAV